MTYRGHVEQGKVVLDEPVALAEGTLVRVELAVEGAAIDSMEGPTLTERLASVIGKAQGLPVDWSERHDQYLRDEHSR